MTINPIHLTPLLAAATVRPWYVRCEPDTHEDFGHRVDGVYATVRRYEPDGSPYDDDERIIETDSGVYPPFKPDADLIVAAVNSLHELLAIAQAALSLPDCWAAPAAHQCGTFGADCPACNLTATLDRARGGK